MATTIDKNVAAARNTIVLIKGEKKYEDNLFALEISYASDDTTDKTIQTSITDKQNGNFKDVQFRYDKGANYIYTTTDSNSKDYSRIYKGNSSQFSVTESGDNIKKVIKVNKTNNETDWSQIYEGSELGVEIKIQPTAEIIGPTKPTEGIIKEGSGADADPQNWKIVNMKDKPALFKVVDVAGKNVATDFSTTGYSTTIHRLS